MLTPRQAELLRFLSSWQDEGGSVSPTFDQMAGALGLKSKSGIHRLITSLEERGFIQRLPRQARSIRVIAGVGGTPRRPVTAKDLRELVARLCIQEGPEITIAALADSAREVAALFISVEGHA